MLDRFVWWRRTRRHRAKKRRKSVNRYTGATLRSSQPSLPSQTTHSLQPKTFFDTYVKRRQPVILNGLPTELKPLAERAWLDTTLPTAAAKTTVHVETRSSPHEPFGRGRRVQMTFKELDQHIKANSHLYYLTTQPGCDELVTPPLDAVAADLPLSDGPGLLPSLRLQSVNLWLGRSNDEAGTSSGLHHDFHDNLYVVLRGAKHLELYSPADAERMHTAGTIVRVHPNGRINYAGARTSADGRSEEEIWDCAWDRARRGCRRAKARLAEAEECGEAGSLVERAEERLDRALERRAFVERAHARVAKRARRRARREAWQRRDPSTLPSNFCRAKPEGAPSAYARLEAGDMLYLPCGWFHDVTSFGEHAAVNFWFDPPDRDDFGRPYSVLAG